MLILLCAYPFVYWTDNPVNNKNNIPKWIMSQNSKEIIAKNIKRLREARKLTREELSLALGFENSYISKLEKQKMNITIEKLDKLADYFETKTVKLFD